MSRDLASENAALRVRLHDAEARARLLAHAVLAGHDSAEPLARLLLGCSMDADGVSQRPPSDLPAESLRPASTPNTEVSPSWPT